MPESLSAHSERDCPVNGCVVCMPPVAIGVAPDEWATLHAERDRYREALEQIADKTWATQYDESVGAVVRFASQVHHMARSAIEPLALDQERADG